MTIEALLDSFCAVSQVFLLLATGIIAARYPRNDPILNTKKLKPISDILVYYVYPALYVLALAQDFTIETLKNNLPIIFLGISHDILSMLFAFSVSSFITLPTWFHKNFVAALTFNNAFALPVILMNSLCFSKKEYLGLDVIQCEKDTLMFAVLYSFGSMLVLWPFAYIYFDPKSDETTLSRAILRTIQKPVMLAFLIGMIIGLVPHPKEPFWGTRSVTVIIKSLKVLGDPAVGMLCIILNGSLGNAFWHWYDKKKKFDNELEFVSRTNSSNISSKLKSIETNKVNVVQIMSKNTDEIATFKLSLRSFAMLVSLKMIILPIILLFGLRWISSKNFSIKNNRLLGLFLQIECITPTANVIVGLSYQFGLFRAAETTTMAICVMYLLSIFSHTAFLALFLSNVF